MIVAGNGSANGRSAAGADGCREGWVYVVVDPGPPAAVRRCAVAPTFSELLMQTGECAALGIDIPIGLPNLLPEGGRSCDRAARDMLKPDRHPSVFSAPPRGVLDARSYDEANELHRANAEAHQGMSRQAFGLLPRIAEVDDLMTPRLQRRVFEVHPELSFMELNGGIPLHYPKTSAAGLITRMRLLTEAGLTAGLEDAANRLGRTGLDDLLDATAAAWSAARILAGAAKSLPDHPEKDVRGLRMEIWR
jgi:predicted RNase H-like nuclease